MKPLKLKPDDLDYLSQCAIAAARQAGQLIASYASKTVAVEHKRGGGNLASQVVTEVDLLSEAAIVKALMPGCKQYDLALLTEERADDKTRLQKDYFWCIDPLDGTLNFINSTIVDSTFVGSTLVNTTMLESTNTNITAGYTVSIALVSQDGTPLIGVVYDPVTHTLYTAVKGQGAFRNGKPWSVASPASMREKTLTKMQERPLTLAIDRSLLQQPYYPHLYQALVSLANQRGYAGLQTLQPGGAVMNACQVLENPPACYVKCPKPGEGGGSLWDFAATALIFHELGAVASDAYGQALDLNRADSTFMNHRGTIFATDQALATDLQGVLEQCMGNAGPNRSN